MRTRRLSFHALSTPLAGLALLAAGCGSSSDGPVGGPVSGLADAHCGGVTPIVVSQASCHPAGATGADPGTAEPEAPVLYNAEGDDDDCKYHVTFSSTPVRRNENVTFDVTATTLAAPATAATGADIQIESYVSDNQFHVLPNSGSTTVETPAASGKYQIGPVKFDTAGRWVVRFHLYEDCSDLSEDSPHGHVAFYVEVP